MQLNESMINTTPKAEIGLGRDVFELDALGDQFKVHHYPSWDGTLVPRKVDGYRFREAELREFMLLKTFPQSAEGIFLYGPHGTGKTSLVEQVHARLNQPLIVVQCSDSLKFRALLEKPSLKGDTLTYELGPLALGAKYGIPVLLDEVTNMPPDESAGLNAILDGSPLLLEKRGEVITPTKGFRVYGTANNAGERDTTGLYRGVKPLNMATRDRWVFVKVGYMSAEDEEAVLAQLVPALPEKPRKLLVQIANEVRSSFVGAMDVPTDDALELTISTRKLLQVAHYACGFKHLTSKGINPIQHAIERCLLAGAEPSTRDAIKEIVRLKSEPPTR